MDSSPRSAKIRSFFGGLNRTSLHLVREFYSNDARFEDPVVALSGADAIERYYAGLYENVIAVRFDFRELVGDGKTFCAVWTMYLTASKLNSGREVIVPGSSHIVFSDTNDEVIYHRDYFDMGAFIYEHVPVLGSVIRFVKAKLH